MLQTRTCFIGRTHIIANVLRTKIPVIHAGQADAKARRMILGGPPGVGKSSLAFELALEIAAERTNVETRIGSTCSVEVIRDWVRNACFRPLFGQMSVKLVDEIDTIKPDALAEIRGYLDSLPLTEHWVRPDSPMFSSARDSSTVNSERRSARKFSTGTMPSDASRASVQSYSEKSACRHQGRALTMLTLDADLADELTPREREIQLLYERADQAMDVEREDAVLYGND